MIRCDGNRAAAAARRASADAGDGGQLPVSDAGWAYEMKWDGLRALALRRRRRGPAQVADRPRHHPRVPRAGWAGGGGRRRTGGPRRRDRRVRRRGLAGLRGAAAADEHQLGRAGQGAGGPGAGQLPGLRPALAGRPAAARPAVRATAGAAGRARPGRRRTGRPRRRSPARPAPTLQAVSQQQRPRRHHGQARCSPRYEPGRRTPAWRKIKNVPRQEVVIGGWKPGEGGRAGEIGSLLVGVLRRRRAGVQRARRHRVHASRRCGCSRRAPGAAAPGHLAIRGHRPARGRPFRATGSSRSWWPRSSSRTGPGRAGCARRPTRGCATTRTPPR